MTKAGYEIDTTSSGALQNSLFKVKDAAMRKGMETLLVKTMSRAKYVVAGKTPPEQLPHFALNLNLYTHFTNPSRRYADIVVHRQLEAALSDGAVEFAEDMDSLMKTAEQCNTKKDSAQAAQEQSVHIESCRIMDKKRNDLGTDLIAEGIVICVYESAFDVLIPEYGFEKRVHCDQLPLQKAEFRKDSRVLELYWEKGVGSAAYVPEDERQSVGHRQTHGARATQNNTAEIQRKQTETGTIPTDDVDALFDDDDDAASEITEVTAGVALDQVDRGMSNLSVQAKSNDEGKSLKEKYAKWFKLREENGQYIQDVTEMTRVPVILRTDLTKSPP